MAIDRRTHNGM